MNTAVRVAQAAIAFYVAFEFLWNMCFSAGPGLLRLVRGRGSFQRDEDGRRVSMVPLGVFLIAPLTLLAALRADDGVGSGWVVVLLVAGALAVFPHVSPLVVFSPCLLWQGLTGVFRWWRRTSEVRRAGTPTTVHVPLSQDEAGYPPFEFEEVRTERLADSTYRLTAAPVFAMGMAVGDVVAVERRAHSLWATAVVEQGTHSTVRVIPLGGPGFDEPLSIAARYGCSANLPDWWKGTLVLDVPPSVDFFELLGELERGKEQGRWDVEIGCYPPGFTPA